VSHFLIDCPLIKEVWQEATNLTRNKGKWQGRNLESCLEPWFKEKTVKEHRLFPV
jgi:hypothetical protein